MIVYKCDVCDKTETAPTAAYDMRCMPPIGWLTRRGRTTSNHEVYVVVCSKVCGEEYDAVEAKQVGFSWSPVIVSSDDGFKGIFPLKARRGRK